MASEASATAGAGVSAAAAKMAKPSESKAEAGSGDTNTVLRGKFDTVSSTRTVVKSVESRWQAEGVGARVRRSIGRPELRNLDPFLMLDEFSVKEPAGFPDHPHRGFETVTFMLKGKVMHEDFCGHRGVIGPGDLQWMTAGKGIVHCEMPADEEENVGLQLWINLAAKDKMVEPAYQELVAKDIPTVSLDGVTANVIAGSCLGVTSPVYTRTPTMYLDIHMEPGKSLPQAIPEGWTAFAYVLTGDAMFGTKGHEKKGPAHHTIVFSAAEGEDGMRVVAGSEGCRLVIIGGKPLEEPIVQHGPFVMNTREEIMEAMMDYQFGRNGFERAPDFESFAIKKRRGEAVY